MKSFDDLQWFIGILEGEGCFHSRHTGLKRVQIVNLDHQIIDRCQEILTKRLILSKRYVSKCNYKGNIYNKVAYQLYISQIDCCNLYKQIIGKMQCRADEFRRMMNDSETDPEIVPDLSWLIGNVEAEGAIYLTKSFVSKTGGSRFSPYIKIANTNAKIVSKIIKTVDSLSLHYNVQRYAIEGKKPYDSIDFSGLSRCKYFLESTAGLWQSNRNVQRSRLLLEFIDSRLNNECYQNAPYCNREIQIYHEIKLLNTNYQSVL